jgi:DNA-directed RNA polymerase sigma subunit (sigma70/sigma32)
MSKSINILEYEPLIQRLSNNDEDLFQDLCESFLISAKSYKAGHNCKFSSYAVDRALWVKRKHIQKNSLLEKKRTRLYDKHFNDVYKAYQKELKTKGSVNKELLAKQFNLSIDQINELIDFCDKTETLEFSELQSEYELVGEFDCVEEKLDLTNNLKILEIELNKKADNNRYSEIIQNRWLKENEDKALYKDLASSWGVHKERVRQIDAELFNKVKSNVLKNIV